MFIGHNHESFRKEKVLVTGGTRGIGKATAAAFRDEGADVIIAGSNDDSLSVALSEFKATAKSHHTEIVGVHGNIASVSDCERMVQFAVEQLTGLDILVNSAGVFQAGTIAETDENLWDHIMNINVKGSYFCSRAAAPALTKYKGSIVHLGSESGINGYAGTTAYCASKGAIVNLTRAMAMELAPEVRVNAVCPGVVNTDMARQGFAIEGDEERGIEQQRNSYPLQRVATAEEIASAILYLASDDARFITGESLIIDGGATVGK